MKPTLSASLKAAPFVAVLIAVSVHFAATAQTPMPDPLDDRSVRRLDKMEKVVRELRAIVFQGRDSGKPVVVQDAETGAMVQTLTDRVGDLEQTLTRNNAGNEDLALELDRTKQALATSEANNRILADRLGTLEGRIAALEAAAAASPTEERAATTETPVDPDELFALGRKQMADGDYSAAEVSFDRYVDEFGDTPKAPEA
ncbi:MAG: ygbF, partial [Caulobacter sp.]|nr:ygbF [Caulobacter sp.]